MLTQFIFVQDKDFITDVKLVGNAATRSNLAAFGDAVESHYRFDDAEIPISNLAKDRDINFTMTVTMTE